MIQHKKISDIENTWSLYDLIDAEIDAETTPHYLEKCTEISPQRFNELVLEVLRQYQDESVA